MIEQLSGSAMRCENCGELLLESRSKILDKMKNGIKEQNITNTCSNCGQIHNK
jgi:RNase P subunit RPR2